MSYWGGTAIGAVTVDGTSKSTTHQIYSNSSDEYVLGIRSDATVGRGVFIRAGSNDNYESLLVTSYDESHKRFAIMGGGTVIFGEDGAGNLAVDPGTKYQFNGGKVFVTGSKDGDYITEIRNEDADNGYGLRVSAGDDNNVIALAVANKDQSTKLVVTGAGNLGVGETTPGNPIHIKSDSGTGIRMYVDESNPLRTAIVPVSTSGNHAGYISFRTMQHNIGGDPDQEHMVINSQGNVGIGTNSPSQPLHIKSATPSILFTDNSNGELGYIGDGADFLTSNSITDADTFGIRSSGAITFGTNGNNGRMVITSAGNVGIRTATPSFHLEVNGTFYSAGSSKEYKEDISDLEIDSSLIYNLRPVSYNLKDEFKHLGYDLGGHKQLGLISEEVNDIIPELAIIKDGKPKNVDYEKLSILLLKEVQNLRGEIDNLKKVQ